MQNSDAYLLFRVTFGYIPLQSLPDRLLGYINNAMENHNFQGDIPEMHENMSAEDEHEGLDESAVESVVNQYSNGICLYWTTLLIFV